MEMRNLSAIYNDTAPLVQSYKLVIDKTCRIGLWTKILTFHLRSGRGKISSALKMGNFVFMALVERKEFVEKKCGSPWQMLERRCCLLRSHVSRLVNGAYFYTVDAFRKRMRLTWMRKVDFIKTRSAQAFAGVHSTTVAWKNFIEVWGCTIIIIIKYIITDYIQS